MYAFVRYKVAYGAVVVVVVSGQHNVDPSSNPAESYSKIWPTVNLC